MDVVGYGLHKVSPDLVLLDIMSAIVHYMTFVGSVNVTQPPSSCPHLPHQEAFELHGFHIARRFYITRRLHRLNRLIPRPLRASSVGDYMLQASFQQSQESKHSLQQA